MTKKRAATMLETLLAQQAPPRARRPSPPRTPTSYRCVTCDHRMTTQTACDEHTAVTRHYRIEQLIHGMAGLQQ